MKRDNLIMIILYHKTKTSSVSGEEVSQCIRKTWEYCQPQHVSHMDIQHMTALKKATDC